MSISVGVLTVSDRASRGVRVDESGPMLTELAERLLPGASVTHRRVVPDEQVEIRAVVLEWCAAGVELILTTGGTGFAPRDVTPEAIGALLERQAPGIVQVMLQTALLKSPHAMLSRPVAGMRGRTLIVTFPGSPKACRENFEALAQALPHGLELLREDPSAETRH